MSKKIFRAIMTAALAVMLACIAIIMGFLYEYFAGLQTQQFWEELSLAAGGVEGSGIPYLQSLSPTDSRLTWIDPEGQVLFDSQTDAAAMENHADRQEVRQALETGRGESRRYSGTLLEKTLYCATRLSDGSVLRISVSTASLGLLVLGILQPICVVLAIVLVLSLVLADRLSKRIVQPLNTLDLDHPLENNTYDEIAPLLRRISRQSQQISTQVRELRRKTDEFSQITASMREGLVLLDRKGVILSINPAAASLLCADSASVGRDFLTVERSHEISEAVTQAHQDGHSEVTMERSGRIYQMDLSRIDSQGADLGVVLLIFDITDKVDAERTRREFTANVSHELKTPLTAILGSSELLNSGMVQPEDVPRFAGHIHGEASRLLTLIEDIIRLSQLDEGASLPTQETELSSLVMDAVTQLQEQADKAQVTLTLNTESRTSQTVPRLFHEIVYNLVENAIKYNVPGGSVAVGFTDSGVLTVADTGIGIPAEEQERVFERFYRVDKSHSKAIGGTGLGLSIVKHAAAYLGASIDLSSTPGVGTTITVTFPA